MLFKVLEGRMAVDTLCLQKTLFNFSAIPSTYGMTAMPVDGVSLVFFVVFGCWGLSLICCIDPLLKPTLNPRSENDTKRRGKRSGPDHLWVVIKPSA